jgi:tetratricopeptide (TPR) repeat protein
MTSHRVFIAHAAAIALGTFVVYAFGACRTIYVGDSGELVAAAATLGIPHPSGYPLYVLLGFVWIKLLPIGSVAFRMSLLSAACASLTCAGLYLVIRRAKLGAWAGFFASLLLAFSPSFWSQANVQRVYALNALFVVAVVGLVNEWRRSHRTGWLTAAAFVAGLGAANHTVMLVIALVAGTYALFAEPQLLRRPLALTSCIGAGLAGLLPYVYLPLRSAQQPRLDWGNPETLAAFTDVVLRRDFWHRAWISSPGDAVPILADYLMSLGHEMLWIGAACAVWAVVTAWCRFPVALPLMLMAANLVVVALHGSRADIFIWHRYYLPSYLMAALLAGHGYQLAVERWGRRARALLAVPLVLLAIGWSRHDRHDYRIAEDFSRTLLESLPPGAHLTASDDNILFVLIYLHLVEGLRPDVNLILQGVGDADLPPLRFDPDDDPLFLTHHPSWQIEGLEVVPVGLVFRAHRSGSPMPAPVVPKTELDGAWDPAVPKDYLTQNLVGQFHFMLGMTYEQRDWPQAQHQLEMAAGAAPRNDVLLYNLGLVYRRNGLFQRSLAAFQRSQAINPRHIPSARPVRAADRVVELHSEVSRLATIEAELRRRAGLDGEDAATHHRLAELLEDCGEAPAARGHRLLASELERASGVSRP